MSVATPNGQVHSESGPYVLRTLIENTPLDDEEDGERAIITCVDFWNDNLYVGTSHGELLHYVRLPAEQDSPASQTTLIQASRQRLSPTQARPQNGIRQILLLPAVSKAAIVCDNTLMFFDLPEMAPANGFQNVSKCTWVGGLDQDTAPEDEEGEGGGVGVLLCSFDRLRLIRVLSTGAKGAPHMNSGGLVATSRRGAIACVADRKAYSLLDVEERQRMPLFNINSATTTGEDENGKPEVPDGDAPGSIETHPSRLEVSSAEGSQGRSRTPSPPPSQNSTLQTPPLSQFPQRGSSLSPGPTSDQEKSSAARSATPQASSRSDRSASRPPEKNSQITASEDLHPHIISPTPSEFLLTMGTSKMEPGIGTFVNLDGDPVRGTLDFSRYPRSLVVDGKGVDPLQSPAPGQPQEEGYVLALVTRGRDEYARQGLEIQRWDLDPNESGIKHWLQLQGNQATDIDSVGLRSPVSKASIAMLDVVDKLQLKTSPSDDKQRQETITKREKSEREFVARLCSVESKVVAWLGDCIWWVVRTPLVISLDSRLQGALLASQPSTQQQRNGFIRPHLVEAVINDLRGQEPRSELEFLSIRYIRQKASLLLFMDALRQTLANQATYERDLRVAYEALTDGDIDPRAIISLLPVINVNSIEGEDGLWLPRGISDLMEDFVRGHQFPSSIDPQSPLATNILQLVKGYLVHWRKMKGFGSVSDDKAVFQSVDSALVHLLLILDSATTFGTHKEEPIRKELYHVVDNGVEDFTRAVDLLESFKRLYVLSRLYNQRGDKVMVLKTWRRILDGEEDRGGDFRDSEKLFRHFLRDMPDASLVKEHGTWLAKRNPKLGILVFSDEASKVKFAPDEVIDILKENAPEAVKDFLEHLVFAKNLARYANNLIGYYLDSVLEALGTHYARDALEGSYRTYRALRPPKPTYSQFIADNGPKEEWWHNRLRLLQLLGGSHGAASQYDTAGSLKRIEPFKELLVPETIILGGRQGRHEDAIHLLTHGLGDFDTAISYCVLGGSSTYSPMSTEELTQAKPSREKQVALFQFLLEEFFKIENPDDRITQTTELLERYARWFDVVHVLSLIPDSWAIEHFTAFFESALRQLLTDRNEALVTRALTSLQNLDSSAKLIEKIDTLDPVIQEVLDEQEAG